MKTMILLAVLLTLGLSVINSQNMGIFILIKLAEVEPVVGIKFSIEYWDEQSFKVSIKV